MATVKEVEESIAKVIPNCEEVIIRNFGQHTRESRICKNGIYRVTLDFEAKEILKNPNSLPRYGKDCIYVPHIILVKFRGDKHV